MEPIIRVVVKIVMVKDSESKLLTEYTMPVSCPIAEKGEQISLTQESAKKIGLETDIFKVIERRFLVPAQPGEHFGIILFVEPCK